MYVLHALFAIQKFLCCLYFVYNYAQNLLVYLVFGIVNYQRVKYLGVQAKVAHNLFCLCLEVFDLVGFGIKSK